MKNRQPIFTSNKIPPHLLQYELPFSQCSYMVIEEGEVLSQLIPGTDYAVWVHYLFLTHTLKAFVYSSRKTLSVHFMRRGGIQFNLTGDDQVTVKNGHAVMLYFPSGVRHETFLEAGFHSAFEMNINPSHLVSVAKEYPVFEQILDHATKGLMKANKHLALEFPSFVNDIIDKIVKSVLPFSERALFIEARTLDLLRWYVRDQAGQQASAAKQQAQHEKIANNIRRYIEEHLNEKLSVNILARHAGIGHSLLQEIFQKEFHKAVHTVVNEKRMEWLASYLRLPMS